MSECEVCGKRAETKARIESAILNVCKECAKLGEEIREIKVKVRKVKLPEEFKFVIKDNFSLLVRREREKRNLSQEELASRIKEKVSVIKRIEDGWEPDLRTVKKLERFFGVELLEEVPEVKIAKKNEMKKLTIGDVVEVRG